MTAHITNVPATIARVAAMTFCSSAPVVAAAACRAKMVCKAVVGMPKMMSTRSSVTNTEYSSGPILRATVCTSAISTPPTLVAMNIQLL